MDTTTRGLTPSQIRRFAAILRAVETTARVELAVVRDDDLVPVVGIARHVVEREDGGFASRWTDDCLLRLTSLAGFEHFIRLGDIVEVSLR